MTWGCRRSGRFVVLSLAAVLLAYAAEVAILHDTARAGGWLLAVSAIAYGVFLLGMPEWRAEVEREIRLPAGSRLTPLRWAMLAVSVALAARAVVVVQRAPLSQHVTEYWLVSLGVFLLALWTPRRPSASGASPRNRALLIECAAVAVMVGGGFILRAYALDAFPSGSHGDEAEFGLEALRLLRGQRQSPFVIGWMGHPTLYMFVQAFSLHLFGNSLGGLRMLSAISGTVLLLVLYLSVRVCFGRRTALLATALQAVSGFDIHFSRMALNNIQTPLFWVPAFALVITGLRSGRWFDFGASGVLAGLSLYFYYGSRLIPLIFALFFLSLCITRRGFLRAYGVRVLSTAAGAALAFAPLGVFFLQHPEAFTARAMQYSMFQNWGELCNQYRTHDPLAVIWHQILNGLASFVSAADQSTFFPTGGPMIDTVIAPLFFLGLAVATLRWRSPRYRLVALWFWLTFIFGGVLSINAPYMPRLVGLAPAVFILTAMAVDEGLLAAEAWLPDRQVTRAALGVVCLLLVGVTGWRQLNDYFVRFAAAHPWPISSLQGEYIAGLKEQYVVYVAGAPNMYFTHGTTQFLAQGVQGGDLIEPDKQLPIPLPSSKGLAFLVYPYRQDVLGRLRAVYPQGQESEVFAATGQKAFTAFFVPAESR